MVTLLVSIAIPEDGLPDEEEEQEEDNGEERITSESHDYHVISNPSHGSHVITTYTVFTCWQRFPYIEVYVLNAFGCEIIA